MDVFFNKNYSLPKKALVIMKDNEKKSQASKSQKSSTRWNRIKTSFVQYKNRYLFFALVAFAGYSIATGFFNNIGVDLGEAASGYLHLPQEMSQLKDEVSQMNEDISALRADINNTNQNVDNLMTEIQTTNQNVLLLENELSSVKRDVDILKESAIQSAFLKLSSTADIKVELGSSKMEYVLASPTWLKTDVIAKSLVTQKEYTAADLVDKPLLLTYVENGQDVVFMGQFNENNHWNKSCVVNVYNDGKLVVAMDAMYDDGVLLSYKQVRMDTSSKGNPTWVLSTKVSYDEYNTGDSWTYLRTKDYYQELPLENIQPENVITYEKFLNILSEPLEGFYHGNTADGLYNDSTGDAYLVKYNEKGFVTLLYQGNFKNGLPDDDTGNAWYVAKDVDTEYMYYKGFFAEGKPVRNPESVFVNPVSISDIEELIGDKEFACELLWEAE